MMRAPASSTARASFIATPFGVAKKTTSQPRNAWAPGSLKARSTCPRSPGNRPLTGVPASLREVIARSVTPPCWLSKRSSSTPVYPVPPTIPALITFQPRKRESRPEAAFDSRKLCRRSTFRVLLAPPCLVQAHLLALHLARIAGDQTRAAEGAFQPRIILDQRARNSVPHRTGLAAFAASVNVHQDVESGEVLRQVEGLTYHHAAGFPAEELIDRLAVHHEAALAWLEEDPGDGA